MLNNWNKNRKAFTLIELLIVIGILAVLATTVLLVINPAQLVKQSRDANRITEINQINKALLLFQGFGGSSSAMGNSNTIYISLPDTDSQCGSYYGQLTATTTGWNYHCSTSANYRNIDGTGWIPVDLTSIQSSAGTLFSNLPVDIPFRHPIYPLPLPMVITTPISTVPGLFLLPWNPTNTLPPMPYPMEDNPVLDLNSEMI